MIDANNLTLTQAVLLGVFLVVCIFLMVGAFHFYFPQAVVASCLVGIFSLLYFVTREPF